MTKSYDNLFSLETLRNEHPEMILATYLVGSRAYGTATPESDEDYRGIFVLPAGCYLTISEPVKQVADEKNNVTYYTLKRFLELAATANPNIIEMLFMPEDCRVYEAPLMKTLLDAREMFITKQAYDSHVNYAMAQIKKAKGKNRWVNHPQPAECPGELDFCWFLPRDGTAGDFPYRPIPLKKTGISLEACVCAKLEQSANIYRLYRDEVNRRGVFRNGMLVCESISFAEERNACVGLLIYNRAEHERAMRDHASYWEWMRNRNPSRWQAEEAKERNYDAKNMMHVFRLLLSGEHILREGRPLVRFEGERLQMLLDIRNGEFSYETLMEMAERMFEEFSAAATESRLPETADRGKIDDLLRKMTAEWETVAGK